MVSENNVLSAATKYTGASRNLLRGLIVALALAVASLAALWLGGRRAQAFGLFSMGAAAGFLVSAAVAVVAQWLARSSEKNLLLQIRNGLLDGDVIFKLKKIIESGDVIARSNPAVRKEVDKLSTY